MRELYQRKGRKYLDGYEEDERTYYNQTTTMRYIRNIE